MDKTDCEIFPAALFIKNGPQMLCPAIGDTLVFSVFPSGMERRTPEIMDKRNMYGIIEEKRDFFIAVDRKVWEYAETAFVEF